MKFEDYWEEAWQENSMPEILNEAIRDVAKKAWDAATKSEREACAKACEDVRYGGNGTPKNYEDNHRDGHIDGCNECEWAIRERSNV